MLTYVNGVSSQTADVTRGVPQKSVLGPLLYVLHINNMQRVGIRGTYTVFSDDTVILYSGNAKGELGMMISYDMKLLDNWLRMNMLTLNVKKKHNT